MQPSAMVTHFPGCVGMYRSGWGPGGFLFHGVHADAGFDESQCLDAVDTHILVGMVRVLAHQLDAAVVFGFLDVFHRYVLLSVDIYREQVHVAPKNVVNAVHLFVQYDVSAFEQGVHAVSDDVDGPVALGQVGNMDVIHRADGGLSREERDKSCRAFDII